MCSFKSIEMAYQDVEIQHRKISDLRFYVRTSSETEVTFTFWLCRYNLGAAWNDKCLYNVQMYFYKGFFLIFLYLYFPGNHVNLPSRRRQCNFWNSKGQDCIISCYLKPPYKIKNNFFVLYHLISWHSCNYCRLLCLFHSLSDKNMSGIQSRRPGYPNCSTSAYSRPICRNHAPYRTIVIFCLCCFFPSHCFDIAFTCSFEGQFVTTLVFTCS